MGTGWMHERCYRSPLAGPQDESARLNTRRPTKFTPLACSGATTAEVREQLSHVPPGVNALTISVGGNDLGFAGIVAACGATECVVLVNDVSIALDAFPGRLAAVFSSVPHDTGHVFVIESPDRTTGIFGTLCGNGASPTWGGFEGITAVEAAWATRVVSRLNAALSVAVDAANAAPGQHPAFASSPGSRSVSPPTATAPESEAPPWTWPNPRYINTPLTRSPTRPTSTARCTPTTSGSEPSARHSPMPCTSSRSSISRPFQPSRERPRRPPGPGCGPLDSRSSSARRLIGRASRSAWCSPRTRREARPSTADRP